MLLTISKERVSFYCSFCVSLGCICRRESCLDASLRLCDTICRHLSLDRSEKKEAQHVALDESLHSRPDTSTPYDSLTAREGLGLLQKLLKELPQTQQDIVQLREIEGKSYKEIAAILNLSEEQVKVYLFRARQRIKQKYTEIQGYGL